MLLRTASHGIPAAITLDFLIPRTVVGRELSAVARRSYVAFTVASTARTSSSPAHASTPSTSTSAPIPLTPGGVLTQLDRDVGTFDEQSLAAMTSSQVDTLNSVFPELRTALSKGDSAKVAAMWATLKNRNMLPFLGLHRYDMCSKGVIAFMRDRIAAQQLNEDEEWLVRDMALVCAAGGATDALKGLMLRAIKNEKPDGALALYDQYLEHLRQKGLLPDEVPEEREDTNVVGDVAAIPSPIRDEILLTAIAAHAQKDSFAGALQAYTKAGTRIAPSTVEDFTFLRELGRALKTKVAAYARRLDIAALLSRPPSFMKHLTNLTRDSADISLERLYSSAIAGTAGPDPWLALNASQLGGTRIVLLPDFFWTSFIHSFLSCRRTDLAERLWDDMLRLGVEPEIAAWNALLDGYSHMRLMNAVFKTWEVMRAQRVKPDALSYRALVSAHLTAGQYEEAMKALRTFERDYAQRNPPMEGSPVLAVYNSAIHGLLLASHEEEALAIKKKMEESGPKPDVVTYNTFLRYYGRKGDLKTMAHILQQLEPAGVKADAYTFSTLLAAMLKVRADAAEIVINFMKKQGAVPDTTALTAILDHQLQERTPQGYKVAMELLAKMERGEFGDAKPSAITYTSVLTAINRGNWLERSVVEEESKRIWDAMQRRNIQPNRTAYNVLLKAALENREPEGLENAMRYYRDMARSRVHMSSDTWYILLKGLIDRKQWELAKEVVQDMRDLKANKISGSLRTLINSISRRNARREAAGAAAYQ
ncbi:hypothetical protein BN946_scf185013.g149 [Trametes cinnabarina]|uniref:Pentacotripeptide-repeat region of PRORP domain-containing protein n=1 Tax=Pycnoporus cinnabarinus TaxID=5643 RepID=A0A060SMQ1_PYCCI|nr:hypothetical protein BN946_scf185013.g149 [Trametes cinnabarina]